MSTYKSKVTEQIFVKFDNGVFYEAKIQAISFSITWGSFNDHFT